MGLVLHGTLLYVLCMYITHTESCSCMPPVIQREFCNADVVARVRVLSSEYYLPGENGEVMPIDRDHEDFYRSSVRYAVETQEIYVDYADQEIGYIHSSASGSMCGMSMANDTDYLVFARRWEFNLFVGLCGLTRRWEYTTEDVKRAVVALAENPENCACSPTECVMSLDGVDCMAPNVWCAVDQTCYEGSSYCTLEADGRCIWAEPEGRRCGDYFVMETARPDVVEIISDENPGNEHP